MFGNRVLQHISIISFGLMFDSKFKCKVLSQSNVKVLKYRSFFGVKWLRDSMKSRKLNKTKPQRALFYFFFKI